MDKEVTEKLLSDIWKYLTSRPFQGFPSASKEKVSLSVAVSPSETNFEKVIYESLLESLASESTIAPQHARHAIVDESVLYCAS